MSLLLLSCGRVSLVDGVWIAIGIYNLEPTDEITCVASLSLTLGDSSSQYWVIGSEVLGGPDPNVGGRLTICSTSNDDGEFTVSKVASVTTTASVNDVASIDGKIVVAAGSGVLVYGLTTPQSALEPDLTLFDLWDRGYHYRQLTVQNDKIIVLDALRSVEVLRWKNTTKKLEVVARDHRLIWPVNASLLDESEILVAEGQGHIYSYEIANGNLELSGQYYLGEQITKIIPGSVVSGRSDAKVDEKPELVPRIVFTTSLGRVGVMSEVQREYGVMLTSLERNIGYGLPGPGGLRHSEYVLIFSLVISSLSNTNMLSL